jgi:hypothetical protein
MSEEQIPTSGTTTVSAAIASLPTGGTKVLLQFNKISGAFTAVIGWVDPATLNNDFFIYEEHDNFDFHTDEVRGTYPDYTVVNREQAELVMYESQLDLAAQQKITKQYPVINQVNNIGNAIEQIGRVVQGLLGDKPDADLAAALKVLDEMNDYVTEVKTANNLRKEYYAGSSDYIYYSLADEAAAQEAQLEGGLHEAYGAKQITGGTVF